MAVRADAVSMAQAVGVYIFELVFFYCQGARLENGWWLIGKFPVFVVPLWYNSGCVGESWN